MREAHEDQEQEDRQPPPVWGEGPRPRPIRRREPMAPGAWNFNRDDLVAELVQLDVDGRTVIVTSPPDTMSQGKVIARIKTQNEVTGKRAVEDLRGVLWTLLTALSEDIQDRYGPSDRLSADEVVGAAIVDAARRRT